uniref:Putative ovule protein n=1 Tax=Solanum chacoense TaxID=4108 RepID=A0A0V0HTB3_SOLCH
MRNFISVSNKKIDLHFQLKNRTCAYGKVNDTDKTNILWTLQPQELIEHTTMSEGGVPNGRSPKY